MGANDLDGEVLRIHADMDVELPGKEEDKKEDGSSDQDPEANLQKRHQ
jgi:hypothetical protein